MHSFPPTQAQRKLLGFIAGHIATTGVSPTYEEMQIGLGQKSKNNVHRLVQRLEERGHIKRCPNRARALQVITPVETYYIVVKDEHDEAKLVPMERA